MLVIDSTSATCLQYAHAVNLFGTSGAGVYSPHHIAATTSHSDDAGIARYIRINLRKAIVVTVEGPPIVVVKAS